MNEHDVFISYKRGADEPRVSLLVGALRANGLTVWWDRDIPANAPWEETILEALRRSKIVIVCWSPAAIDSENVRSEARHAKETDKLLQIFVKKCEPPLFFGEHQGLMLLDDADLYGHKMIAVRDAALALIKRVNSPVATLDQTAQRIKLDKLAAAWRRDEPAAVWEPAFFGLTLAILTLPFSALVWYGLLYYDRSIEEADVFAFALALGLAAPVAAFLGGWGAYGLLARRPRHVGFFSGSLTAGLSSLFASFVMLSFTALLGQFGPDRALNIDTASATKILLVITIIGLPGGFGIAWVWLPVFLLGVRRGLRSTRVRTVVLLAAVLAPMSVSAAALAVTNADRDRTLREIQIALLARRAGMVTTLSSEIGSARLPDSEVGKIAKKLGLSASDANTDKMIEALEDQPPKTEWLLAPDNQGDAKTFAEIMDRSAGTITIHIRPGVYTLDRGTENARFDLFHTRDNLQRTTSVFDQEPVYRSVLLLGGGTREQVIIKVEDYLSLKGSDSIANVTLNGVKTQLTLRGGARLIDSALTGWWQVELEPDPQSQADELAELRHFGGRIEGNLLDAAISVSPEAEFDIVGNQFTTPRRPSDGACIYLSVAASVSIYGNDLSVCKPTPDFAAVRAHPRANLTLGDNLGVSDVPQVVRGAGDELDWFAY